jgi:hypothetical protein
LLRETTFVVLLDVLRPKTGLGGRILVPRRFWQFGQK